MNETPKSPNDFEELASLVKASFPNIRCLRCGNDQFYSGLNEYTFARRREPGSSMLISYTSDHHEVITLGCTRCGLLEHHILDVLQNAAKPIKVEPERR